MNFKTTLLLFVLVVAVAMTIFLLKEKAPPQAPTVPEQPLNPGAAVEQNLIEEGFGSVAAITVTKPGQPAWRFERDSSVSPNSDWAIREPVQGAALRWQIDQMTNQLTGLKYSTKYQGASAGVTASSAGLEPPRAVVALSNREGKTVEIAIGRPEGNNEAYVRLGDGETIYRVKSALQSLLKDRAIDYLDQQFFNISGNNVVRLEVSATGEEGERETYEMTKTGSDWEFTKPAGGRAMPDQVRKIRDAFASLRALNWVESEVADPSIYGLGDNALTVTATVEKQPPAKPAADKENPSAEAEPPAPVIETYTVRFSDVGPLGEENKIYITHGDGRLVGAVMKSVADTFRPNLKEWRDNRLLQGDPSLARRVELTTGGETVAFVRGSTRWTHEVGGAPVDQTEMESFLGAIKAARAVNFVSGAAADPAAFGLDAPQSVINLTFDDAKENARITIGGSTDPTTNRLVYVRTGDSDVVAKVHVKEVNAMVRTPVEFRDRTIVAVAPTQLQAITIERPSAATPGGEARVKLALQKTDGAWEMIEPVHSTVDKANTDKLVNLLSDFRAQKLIDLTEDRKLADYGLDAPQVRLSYTYLPPEVIKVGDAETKPIQPPAETYELVAASTAGKLFIQRLEENNVVYQVGEGVMDTLMAEFRNLNLYAFEDAQVTSVTLLTNGVEQGFTNTGQGWEYNPESDLPLDAKMVTNYLLRIKGLKVARVIEYGAGDLSIYGLDAPRCELRVKVDGQALPTLYISERATESGEPYAKSEGANDVFTLPPDTLDQLRIVIDEFELLTP